MAAQFFTPVDYLCKDAFTALLVSLEQRYSVLKIDAVNDLGKGWKIKYNSVSGVTSYVGEKCDTYFQCISNFALARDGCIYIINEKGRMFKIETIINEDDDDDTNDSNDNTSSWAWIADIIESIVC